ncbi:MAG TPA: glycoside hydrolase family 2 TIM barrel-domain containing protein [Spirochaetia bacterium]|nr:glycoside hydrolase family 2 TIM barrel-domain containing protein [Spirochaetia bacterium]
MISQQPSNFDHDIHKVDYLSEYRSSAIDWQSLLNDSGRSEESLDGPWRFSIDPYDTLLRARWFAEIGEDGHGNPRPLDYDWENWLEVDVPSCWNMSSPEYLNYEGAGIYTRTFCYRRRGTSSGSGASDAGGGRERVFLKVGAANYETVVFLNRRFLGTHRGGSTPFFVEVTDTLADDNRVILVVNNQRKSSRIPMDNTDWFNYGGLYRSVSLIRVPETFIKRWSTALVPGSGFKQVRVSVEIDGPSGAGSATLRVPALGVEHLIPLRDGRGTAEFEAQPELWGPGKPVLYDVEVALASGDIVRDRVGFREIIRKDEQILLNGKSIYLKGISCHEDSPANGKAVTRDEILNMFELAQELGCNFVRLAHYPHSETAARLADERGLLLWEEIPVYWAVEFGNTETFKDAENQLSELILRDINRASVILWSVGNENPDTDERLSFMRRLAERAKTLDGTRLVTAACLWNRAENRIADRLTEHLDVIGLNEYYGWYEGNFEDLAAFFRNSSPGKPVIVSEFGAGALAGNFGTVDDLFSENRQREVYRRQIEVIAKARYVAGLTPWILFDFRSPRRLNRFQRGFNRKGLVDADRKRRKLAFFTLQDYYRSR